jgi:hypothetical protein
MDKKAKDSGSKVRATKFGGYDFSEANEALHFHWSGERDWPTELPTLGKMNGMLNTVTIYDAYGNELDSVMGVPPSWDAAGDWFAHAIHSTPETEALLKRAFVIVANPKE